MEEYLRPYKWTTLTQNLLIMQNPDAQHRTCTASHYTPLDEKTQHAIQKQVR